MRGCKGVTVARHRVVDGVESVNFVLGVEQKTSLVHVCLCVPVLYHSHRTALAILAAMEMHLRALRTRDGVGVAIYTSSNALECLTAEATCREIKAGSQRHAALPAFPGTS